MSVCLSVLSACTCLSAFLFVCQIACLVFLCVWLSLGHIFFLYISLCVCPSVYLFTCLPLCLSNCLCFFYLFGCLLVMTVCIYVCASICQISVCLSSVFQLASLSFFYQSVSQINQSQLLPVRHSFFSLRFNP